MKELISPRDYLSSLFCRLSTIALEITLIVTIVPRLLQQQSVSDFGGLALFPLVGLYLIFLFLGERSYFLCLRGTIAKMRSHVFHQLGQRSSVSLGELSSDRLVYFLDQECSTIPKGIMGSQDLLIDVLLVLFNLWIALKFSIWLFLVTLFAPLILWTLNSWQRRTLAQSHEAVENQSSLVHSYIRFTVGAAPLIQHEGMWTKVSERFDAALKTRFHLEMRDFNRRMLTSMIFTTAMIGHVVLLAQLADATTLVAGLTSLGIFLRLAPRLLHVQKHLQGCQLATDSYHKMLNEIRTYPALMPGSLKKLTGIELDVVNFSLSDKPLLRIPLSLTLPSTGLIALVGESGAGKTMLARAIAGLALPHSGHIHYCHHQERSSLAPHAHYLSANSPIYPLSFVDNIILTQGYDEKKMHWALEMCELPKRLLTEDAGFEKRLSQGERQRVLLARLLYQGPGLTVLDEGLSSLDFLREQRLLTHFHQHAEKNLVIHITHNLASVKTAQVILLLHHGELVTGNWDSLARLPNSPIQLFEQGVQRVSDI